MVDDRQLDGGDAAPAAVTEKAGLKAFNAPVHWIQQSLASPAPEKNAHVRYLLTPVSRLVPFTSQEQASVHPGSPGPRPILQSRLERSR